MSIELFRNQPEGAMRGMPYGDGAKNIISRVNQSPETIVTGRGVFAYKGDEDSCMPPLGDSNTLTLSKNMVTGDVLTITLGDGQTFEQAFDTDVATTYASMLSKLNAGSNVVATYATLVFTVTHKYNAIVLAGTATGDSVPTITIGTASASADQICLGGALRSANIIQDSADYPDGIPQDALVSILNNGAMVVEVNDETKCTSGTVVKVSTTEANKGLFVDSSVSSNVKTMPNAFYLEVPPSTDGQLVVVQFSGGVA